MAYPTRYVTTRTWNAPQEVARMLADLVASGVARVRCRPWHGVRLAHNRGHSRCPQPYGYFLQCNSSDLLRKVMGDIPLQ